MFLQLTTGYEAEDDSISLQSRAFYTRLADGGAGYIVPGVEASIADRQWVALQARATMCVSFAK